MTDARMRATDDGEWILSHHSISTMGSPALSLPPSLALDIWAMALLIGDTMTRDGESIAAVNRPHPLIPLTANVHDRGVIKEGGESKVGQEGEGGGRELGGVVGAKGRAGSSRQFLPRRSDASWRATRPSQSSTTSAMTPPRGENTVYGCD